MNKKIIQSTVFMNKVLKRYVMLIEREFEREPGVFKHDIVAISFPSGTAETFRSWGNAIEYLERGGLKEVPLDEFPKEINASLRRNLENL